MDPMQAQIPAQVPWNPYNLVWDTTIPVAPQVQVPVAQIPVQPVAQIPVQPVAQIPMPPVQQMPVGQTPVAPSEGFLEKMVKWLVRFIAKASGNPDPFTGQGGTPVAQIAWTQVEQQQSSWIFGQIGWVFSGIAETAQWMVTWAVAWAEQIVQPVQVQPVQVQPVQVQPVQPQVL